MKKRCFFCDLDRTLIYSHRVPMPEGSPVVEMLNDAPQSRMTPNTYQFIATQEIVELIPVTTRSKTQYDRISIFHTERVPHYALLCNGGILLQDGKEDPEWYDETRAVLAKELEELNFAGKAMSFVAQNSNVHDAHGLFFYMKHIFPESAANELKQALKGSSIDVLYDSRKVYCIPRGLNKGMAVRRFCQKFRVSGGIAAGDSVFDVPMLNAAQTALYPAELEELVYAKEKIPFVGPVISDGICAYLETLRKEE